MSNEFALQTGFDTINKQKKRPTGKILFLYCKNSPILYPPTHTHTSILSQEMMSKLFLPPHLRAKNQLMIFYALEWSNSVKPNLVGFLLSNG